MGFALSLQSTRRNNKKPIIIPVTDKLKDSIALVGDKNSPFLLGLLKEDYDESFFTNRNRKLKRQLKRQLNRKLKDISGQLKLSRPLKLGKARDCYASTLDRQNVPREKISQMLLKLY